MIAVYSAVLLVSFVILFKCADFFIDGVTGIAEIFRMPKMVAGIVLVGLATTAPEFGVSVISAIRGLPEIALGNAIGSVIADDGIALALAAIVAPAVILVNCRILTMAGVFLLLIDGTAYLLAANGIIGRLEGGLFILILTFYFIFMIRSNRLRYGPGGNETGELESSCLSPQTRRLQLRKSLVKFGAGIVGIFLASHFGVIWAAINIAEVFHVSDAIIGLTIIAIGTSFPEISTCITAARKGEGEVAVGNIIGADVLNILWILGMSSLVNPIHVPVALINFSFPFMILVVTVMLVSIRIGCRLTKVKGILLFALYLIYFICTLTMGM